MKQKLKPKSIEFAMLFRMRTGRSEPVQSAPRPGLEPGTISLHVIHNFRYGMDYLISLPTGKQAQRDPGI